MAVFAWYLAHGLPVTPVNPVAEFIEVDGQKYPAVKSLQNLAGPGDSTLAETSVSVVTAPPVTIGVLGRAKDLGAPAVWLQPGTYDDEVLAFANAPSAFGAVLAGMDGSTRGPEGWC